MPIVTPKYFKNEIYLPHAKSSITDDVLEVESSLMDFIAEYEEECLVKVLGYQLGWELMSHLDDSEPNGLKTTAPAKWDWLLNGYIYTPIRNRTISREVQWKGLRFQSSQTSGYDRSLIAQYIYYFYESNAYITRSDVGHQIETSKNADRVTPTQKVVKAWRKFIEMASGSEFNNPDVYRDSFGRVVGVDYFGNISTNNYISLRTFINDMNDIETEGTGINLYEFFSQDIPQRDMNVNQFGI